MLVIIRRLVLVAMLPIALSGCDLLAYTMFPGLIDPELTDPELVDPELTGQTSFRKGSATVDITRSGVVETYTLTEVSEGSTYDTFGAYVSWHSDDGWTVDVAAYGMGGPNDGSLSTGDVNVTWIHDSDVWTAGTYTSTTGHRCAVNIWEMSARILSGKVNCVGIQWADGTDQLNYPPAFVEGQAPFDMSVTFEAKPADAALSY